MSINKASKKRINIRELTLFAILGGIMYATKTVMEFLPNIHLLGTFIVAETVVFGKKALYPIYVYVLLNGLMSGFALWWVPYLYIWAVLWVFVTLLPKRIPKKLLPICYMSVSALHGFLFGALYTPFQAIVFGLDFKAAIAWIIAGIPFDTIHGISNFICGIMIVPLIKILEKAKSYNHL